jgi:hypothetical protein
MSHGAYARSTDGNIRAGAKFLEQRCGRGPLVLCGLAQLARWLKGGPVAAAAATTAAALLLLLLLLPPRGPRLRLEKRSSTLAWQCSLALTRHLRASNAARHPRTATSFASAPHHDMRCRHGRGGRCRFTRRAQGKHSFTATMYSERRVRVGGSVK